MGLCKLNQRGFEPESRVYKDDVNAQYMMFIFR